MEDSNAPWLREGSNVTQSSPEDAGLSAEDFGFVWRISMIVSTQKSLG